MAELNDLTVEELQKALTEKQKQQREAYVSMRGNLINEIKAQVHCTVDTVNALFRFMTDELGAFKSIMAEYGQLREPGQMSFKLQHDDFRVIVKSNKIKAFDERADMAAERLITFLKDWIKQSDKGTDNPMYQLAMTLLERNKQGDLDYKSISKLYELEAQFNSTEYSAIMQLFKESNMIEGTCTNYYFEERDTNGVWRRLEPSFNRL